MLLILISKTPRAPHEFFSGINYIFRKNLNSKYLLLFLLKYLSVNRIIVLPLYAYIDSYFNY
jgi:hypothetical protein